jgi:hypothetical protein
MEPLLAAIDRKRAGLIGEKSTEQVKDECMIVW